uniref:Uncharacterized protein n=1 Tax=Arundo donax TaxID=35708 RepID=A0A0A9DXD0_ARUDO
MHVTILIWLCILHSCICVENICAVFCFSA